MAQVTSVKPLTFDDLDSRITLTVEELGGVVRVSVDLSGIVSSEGFRKVSLFITATDPIWYFGVASIVIGHVLGVVLAHDRAPGRLWSSCRSVPIRAGRIDDRPGLARAGRFWRDEEEIVRKETTDVD